MRRIALKMLLADYAKVTGLLFGIAFTSFLVTFAASYFCGFMTRSFALVAENGTTDVWVMDPAVESVEQTINLSDGALSRVRGVDGVRYAVPLTLGSVSVRFPNGRVQPFQVIGVDDATLAGAPPLRDGTAPMVLRAPDAAVVDAGGTSGKLATPRLAADTWPHDGVHLDAPTRELAGGDVLLANGRRVKVMGLSRTLPRFPPRPLLYTTYSNAGRILPVEPKLLTFVLVTAMPGVSPRALAARIEERTGLRARASEDFETDTLRWMLLNSEDVGDMAAMLTLAMTVGFGVTGVMLFMFTYENLKQYAIVQVLGGTPAVVVAMILAQAAACALVGTGLGLGACAVVGELVAAAGYPFRMLWFTPLLGTLGVLTISATAAAVCIRPVVKLQPMVILTGR